MNLSRLKQAYNYEVDNWLKEKLQLTDYQKSLLYDREIIRFAPFYFYKKKEKQSNILWRLTLPFYGIYFILLFIGLPINFILTGHWGYNEKFYNNFHLKWENKLVL